MFWLSIVKRSDIFNPHNLIQIKNFVIQIYLHIFNIFLNICQPVIQFSGLFSAFDFFSSCLSNYLLAYQIYLFQLDQGFWQLLHVRCPYILYYLQILFRSSLMENFIKVICKKDNMRWFDLHNFCHSCHGTNLLS